MLLTNHNRPPGRRWVLPLREKLGHVNAVPVVRDAMLHSYSAVDAYCRRTLEQLPEVSRVERRGPVTLVPGVSDLDYSITLHRSHWRDVLEVSRTYRRLKRVLVLPGEALVRMPGFPVFFGLSQITPGAPFPARTRAILAHQWYYLAVSHLWQWHKRQSPLYLQRARRLFEKIGGLGDSPAPAANSWQEAWYFAFTSLEDLAQAALTEPGPPADSNLHFRPGKPPQRDWENSARPTPWDSIFEVDELCLETWLEELRSAPRPFLSLSSTSCRLIASGIHWGPADGHLTRLVARHYALPEAEINSHTQAAAWIKGWTYSALLPGELLWKSPDQIRPTLLNLIRIQINLATARFGEAPGSMVSRLGPRHRHLKVVLEALTNQTEMAWEDWVRIGIQFGQEFQSVPPPPTALPSPQPT